MDIQSRIAARRAELDSQAKAEKGAIAELNRQQIADNIERRNKTLDELAAEVSSPDTTVSREDDHLVLTPVAITEPASDEDIKTAAIDNLLKRQARMAWTPAENWLIIGSIVAGICLIPLGGWGLVLLAFGFWRRHVVNKKYQNALQHQYPKLFARIAETPA